jgi:hypothetical protein
VGIGEGDGELAMPVGAGVSSGDEVTAGELDVSRMDDGAGLISGGDGEAVSKGWSVEASVGEAVREGVDVTIVVWSEDVFCVLVSAPIEVMVRTRAANMIDTAAIFRRVGLVILWLSQTEILWSIEC